MRPKAENNELSREARRRGDPYFVYKVSLLQTVWEINTSTGYLFNSCYITIISTDMNVSRNDLINFAISV